MARLFHSQYRRGKKRGILFDYPESFLYCLYYSCTLALFILPKICEAHQENWYDISKHNVKNTFIDDEKNFISSERGPKYRDVSAIRANVHFIFQKSWKTDNDGKYKNPNSVTENSFPVHWSGKKSLV